MQIHVLCEMAFTEGLEPHSLWEEKELAEMWAQAFNEDPEMRYPGYLGWVVKPFDVNLALREDADATL